MGSWTVWFAIFLLILSNVFMSFAWFGHLRGDENTHIFKVILISWGIAFFEYLLMIPAIKLATNSGLSASHIKITQEVISLSVFIPFSIFFLKENFRWDYVWACCCIVGAVFFIFRDRITG